MLTEYYERVNGRIIGPVQVSGGLYYNGRPEGPTLSADNEADLMKVLTALKAERISAIDPSIVRLIYGGKWEARIFGCNFEPTEN